MHTGLKVTTFKERFSDLVADSSFTDSEISRGLRVSKQTISAWKIGTRSPKEPTIITIAQYFHVSVEWLMGFDVPKYGNGEDANKEVEKPVITPKTPEARILCAGIDQMPEDARKKAVEMMNLVFEQYRDYFMQGGKEG